MAHDEFTVVIRKKDGRYRAYDRQGVEVAKCETEMPLVLWCIHNCYDVVVGDPEPVRSQRS